jgi:ribosomal-protein-alanine N-acetyltransferase
VNFDFQPMDLRSALSIVEWEYPPPYEEYNLYGSPLALLRMLEGEYFAAFAGEVLMGFICFGRAAQLVEERDHDLYQEPYLDLGLGMHPQWCSKGLGTAFVGRALEFAGQFWPGGFRLTVASKNLRAMKVYSRLGFREVGRINAGFLVMIRDNPGQAEPGSGDG